MDNGLEKRYGLLTAIAMVVGLVIGSGVFFKAEKVLTATGGNLSLGILAWLLGGLVMIDVYKRQRSILLSGKRLTIQTTHTSCPVS